MRSSPLAQQRSNSTGAN